MGVGIVKYQQRKNSSIIKLYMGVGIVKYQQR